MDKKMKVSAMVKATRIRWIVICAAALFQMLGSSAPAAARGFCNIDSLGGTVLRREVENAGAAFFEGSHNLMLMLALFERGDGKNARDIGLKATSAFSGAGSLYKSVAHKMTEISDDKFKGINVEVVAKIAQTSLAAPIFSEIAKSAEGTKAPTNLMLLCSTEAERMRAATVAFLDTPKDQEKIYAALLTALGRSLDAGRTVSAFFAAAGGEK
ncbi:hypothetical protein [Bradyrhizobium sp. USDA 4520]